MKYYKKSVIILLSLALVATLNLSAVSIFAAVPYHVPDDLAGKTLVSTTTSANNGIYVTEKIYVEDTLQTYAASATTGTTTCTKVTEFKTGNQLVGKYSVLARSSITATFHWNKSAKTVTVLNSSAKSTSVAGAKVTKGKKTIAGNATSKATVKHTFKYKSSTPQKMTSRLSCKYNGKIS